MKKIREVITRKRNPQFPPIKQSQSANNTTTSGDCNQTSHIGIPIPLTTSKCEIPVQENRRVGERVKLHTVQHVATRSLSRIAIKTESQTISIQSPPNGSSLKKLSSTTIVTRENVFTRRRSILDTSTQAKNGKRNHRPQSQNRSPSKGRRRRTSSRSDSPLCREPPRERARLEKQSYFHGVLPRNEVVSLLHNEGDFLIREAGTSLLDTHIMLSVMHKKQLRHLDLQPADNGLFIIEGHGSFQTVPELISYYIKHEVPVTNKCPVILLKPIARQEWELHHEDVEIGQKLGDGHFGEVYRGLLKTENKTVAIKMYRFTPADTGSSAKTGSVAIKRAKAEFVNEAKLMRKFRHGNIVRLIGICASKDPMMIVMEYCINGPLNAHLSEFKPNVKRKLAYIVDVVKGMAYLELHNCIHRDLAARNCLLNEKYIAKISDFGLSRQSTSPYVTSQKAFPIKWSAPEAVVYHIFTLKSDVWSFGIFLWEVFTNGSIPYPALSTKEVADLQAIPPGTRPDVLPSMPPRVEEIFSRCLQFSPTERPTFSELESKLKEIREDVNIVDIVSVVKQPTDSSTSGSNTHTAQSLSPGMITITTSDQSKEFTVLSPIKGQFSNLERSTQSLSSNKLIPPITK